jgi:dTDP-4-amino-4,6-dideoxygalactose transaminase
MSIDREPELPRRIFLSPPHMSGAEQGYVAEAFESNWIAPLGPNVDLFEEEFGTAVGSPHAAALSSGTAALHLALILVGVGRGDDVIVPTLTFAASVNPIVYLGANPIFIDSERRSWNMDPDLLAAAIDDRARAGRCPKAVVVVHLYGQTTNMAPVMEVCERHGVALVEDAAEALGATYRGRAAGTLARAGVFSFNGNKIITTGGGGMLVSDDAALIARARKLATQARDPAPHYEHSEIGYNYRMSNVLAGIGRGQLGVLQDRVRARRSNFSSYEAALGDLPGIEFMPEAEWGRHSRWLTTLTIDPADYGNDREAVRVAMEAANIEARPVWKPMHMQPVYSHYGVYGGGVAEDLFDRGLCLPSGSCLSDSDRSRVVEVLRAMHRH